MSVNENGDIVGSVEFTESRKEKLQNQPPIFAEIKVQKKRSHM